MDAPEKCDLCDDVSAELFLHARCHPTAPLMARKEGDVLILSCYLPDCAREVVRLALVPAVTHDTRSPEPSSALDTLYLCFLFWPVTWPLFAAPTLTIYLLCGGSF